jgi:hypothetical protein
MTSAYAAEIATWRYPVPYDYNDMTGADPAFLVSPESGFFALTMKLNSSASAPTSGHSA